MNTNDTYEKQRILYKDNVLVKTKYELTLTENKLYNLLLYKFQKEGNLLKCKITHSEIKEVIKNKEANTISGIHNILSKLSSKKILIEEVKSNNKNSLWHHYNLINGYTYDDEFKDFEIQATEKIYTLLKQKFENGCYTPNNLNIFLNLNNYYAQRLYELLRLWSNTKSTVTYRIDELKDYFMLSNNYKEYGNFKRRIIVPAIKELNKNGLFEITMKENKCGRKVESIDFIIKDLDKRKYFAQAPSFTNNLKDSAKEELLQPCVIETEIKTPSGDSSPSIDTTIAAEPVYEAAIDCIDSDDNSPINVDEIYDMPVTNPRIISYNSAALTQQYESQSYNMPNQRGSYNTYNAADSEQLKPQVHNKTYEVPDYEPSKYYKVVPAKTSNKNTIPPEETILNKACLRLLKIDFKGYDFTDGDLYMAYAEAEAMTMEKDNIDIISVGSYQYFKAVLKSKIEELK